MYLNVKFLIYLNFLARYLEFFTSFFLSFIFGYCFINLTNDENCYFSFYIYLMSCAIYHFFEYLFVCKYHFDKLSFDSNF